MAVGGLFTLLALAGFVVPLVIVLAFLWLRSLARRLPDWEAAATGLGLQRSRADEPGEARFTGALRGREVEVVLRSALPGSPTPVGIVSVSFDDGGLGLRLRRQGMLDRYGSDADLEIGDEAFDRRFVVQAAPSAELTSWLDAARRGALLEAHASFTRVDSGRLVAEVPRGLDGDGLEPRIAALLDLAEELEARATPEPRPAPEVAAPPPTPPPPTPLAPPEEAPPDPPTTEPPVPAELPAELPAERPGELAADTVALALFGDAAASYEISARFDEGFREREVNWTGVLVDRTSSRAELELLALDPTSLSPRVVRARLELSPEAATALAALEGREGSPVEVRARLTGCDAFLRSLTLSDVTLVG